jgi:hypothetical protein
MVVACLISPAPKLVTARILDPPTAASSLGGVRPWGGASPFGFSHVV